MTMDFLGVNGDGRYRVLDEGRVVAGLVVLAWPYEGCDDPGRAARLAEDALAPLIEIGLPFRREGRRRLFDFCEVTNFLKREGLAGRDATFSEQLVPTWRRLTRESMGETRSPASRLERTTPAGSWSRSVGSSTWKGKRREPPLGYVFPCLTTTRRQPEITVEDVGPVPPGAGRPAARLPRVPAQGPGGLVAGHSRARVRFHALRQTFAIGRGGRGHAEADRPGPDVEPFTRHQEGMIKITPAVAALADSLTGPDDDPWEAVNAFWAFFFDRMKPAPSTTTSWTDPTRSATSSAAGGSTASPARRCWSRSAGPGGSRRDRQRDHPPEPHALLPLLGRGPAVAARLGPDRPGLLGPGRWQAGCGPLGPSVPRPGWITA